MFKRCVWLLAITVAYSLARVDVENVSSIPSINNFVDNHSIRINYSVHGFGDPLIFQHSFPDRESTWNTFQRDEFAERYKVITPTLRGCTPSDVPSGQPNYSSQMLASDLLSILDAESIDRAILWNTQFTINLWVCLSSEEFTLLELQAQNSPTPWIKCIMWKIAVFTKVTRKSIRLLVLSDSPYNDIGYVYINHKVINACLMNLRLTLPTWSVIGQICKWWLDASAYQHELHCTA